MARNLTFALANQEFQATPVKIERKKLYGWTETLALDDDGNECKLVTMDESGTVVIPKGGLGLGIVSPDLEWVERDTLKAVTLSGEDAVFMKSSYDAPIHLEETATAEDLLNHNITGVYQLETEDSALVDAVKKQIFTFTYNYRDGYEGSRAFLVESDNTLFMLLGFYTPFEMLSLNEVGVIEEADEEEELEDGDDIDFSMF